jgi:hypothetical protein
MLRRKGKNRRLAGLVAPLLGKQPPDTHVWVLAGNAPAFVKLEGPLYDGGPIGRIELANSGRDSNPSQMHPSVFKQNFLPSGFVCRPVPLLRMNRSPGLAHPMVISLV